MTGTSERDALERSESDFLLAFTRMPPRPPARAAEDGERGATAPGGGHGRTGAHPAAMV